MTEDRMKSSLVRYATIPSSPEITHGSNFLLLGCRISGQDASARYGKEVGHNGS
jgi:hypothetical protein